eukprot:4054841-Amphidinium_carterae.1
MNGKSLRTVWTLLGLGDRKNAMLHASSNFHLKWVRDWKSKRKVRLDMQNLHADMRHGVRKPM